MAINFNPEEFAKNLAMQAQQIVPEDFTPEAKDYLLNKVYHFCLLSGNALVQDKELELNESQSQAIIQCIGEWTFHKTIDLINSKVPQEHWDKILQDIAFIIFEAGKHAANNKMKPDESRSFIEVQVKNKFKESLTELVQGGKLDPKDAQAALNQSNINKMVDEGKVEVPPENQNKNIKLASFALYLQTRPKEEVQLILDKIDPSDANIIMGYIKIPDLKDKLDPNIASRYVAEIQAMIEDLRESLKLENDDYIEEDIPESIYIDQIKDLNNLYSAVEIEQVIRHERPKIHKYINFCVRENYEKYSNFKVSIHIERIIYEYIKSKLTA